MLLSLHVHVTMYETNIAITAFMGPFNDDAPYNFFTSLLVTLSDFDPDNGVSNILFVSGMN